MSFNASKASLASANSSSPLSPSQPKKDYAAALSNLQTTYGGNGLMPTPVHAIPSQFTTTGAKKDSGDQNAAKSQKDESRGTFNRLVSRLGLSEKDPKKSTAMAPIPDTKDIPSASRPKGVQKDYEAAFGALSSQYGFGATSTPRKS
ncbi:hypothetical protein BDN72DRAFT_840955 [Pluteus cervinus]|uniref:Uncharacterized protein n=1 Tax=Pluteus cervinus TaxID=181527 RepID=A0ACD3AUW3_9AGAR|nr:hypothetical protein BDN72DRAFT_840955 [Pluteus cervinus]